MNRSGQDSGDGDDRDVVALHRALDGKLHHTGRLGIEGVVLADADVFAGMELGATLAHDDVAGCDELAAKSLDAEAFRF